MKTPHIISSIMIEILHRVLERLRLPRTRPPAEVTGDRPPSARASKLGHRPGRYHGDSVANGRRLSAKRLRRWLRSG